MHDREILGNQEGGGGGMDGLCNEVCLSIYLRIAEGLFCRRTDTYTRMHVLTLPLWFGVMRSVKTRNVCSFIRRCYRCRLLLKFVSKSGVDLVCV